MSGWKEWQIGEVVEASDFQSFVQDQVVQVYADSTARGSALGTAASEGMVSYLQDTNATEVFDGASWIAVGAGDITEVVAGTALTGGGTSGSVTLNVDETELFTGGTAGYTALSAGTAGLSFQPVSHNYIINGAFDIWQRGTSFTVTSEVYTADRFTARDAAVSRSTDVPTNEGIQYSLFYDNAGTRSGINIRHYIEDAKLFRNKTFTFSFWLKSSIETDISVDLTDSTAETISVTTSWQRYSFTQALGNVNPGGIVNDAFWIDFNLGLDYPDVYVTGVQLEAGSVATPFKRNAPSLQGELAACQRYFTRIESTGDNDPIANGFANSTTQVFSSVSLPVPMRTTPTFSTSATASQFEILRQGTSIIACSSLPALSTASTLSANVSFTVASGLSAGEGVVARQDSGSFLDFSAEL